VADPNNPGATNPTLNQSSGAGSYDYDAGDPDDIGGQMTSMTGGSLTSGQVAAAGTSPASSSTGSSLLSDAGSFLSSPLGEVAGFGALAGVGLEEASSQQKQNNQLAGTLGVLGQPFTAAGDAELAQLEGGPAVGGPLGASITQQTGAAAELGATAQQYGTGQLTSAQQLQVSQYVAQQKAQVASELAASGNNDPNSTQYQTAYQQIDNNAVMLTQQLVQQNTQLAEGALTAVQSTYSNLLNQALSSSGFGFETQSQAVQTLIQGNSQIAGQIQQLMGGIAQGYGAALGGGKTGSAAAGLGAAVGSAARGGAGSGVASSASGGGVGLTSAQQTEEADTVAAGTAPDIATDTSDISSQIEGTISGQASIADNPFGGDSYMNFYG
jgi:hypothetical protein